MLARYYAEITNTSVPIDTDATTLFARDPAFPCIDLLHDFSDDKHPVPVAQLPSARRAYQHANVVILIRHPGDALVSYYHHAVQRLRKFNGTISDFLRDERWGLERYLWLYRCWASNLSTPQGSLIARYEDFNLDPVAQLARLLHFLEVPIDLTAVSRAVDASRFEQMQRLERTGALQMDGRFGGQPALHDNGLKVRRGEVGGFISELSKEDIAFIDRAVERRLSPMYGYTGMSLQAYRRRSAVAEVTHGHQA